jgi:hypothetical protein
MKSNKSSSVGGYIDMWRSLQGFETLQICYVRRRPCLMTERRPLEAARAIGRFIGRLEAEELSSVVCMLHK